MAGHFRYLHARGILVTTKVGRQSTLLLAVNKSDTL